MKYMYQFFVTTLTSIFCIFLFAFLQKYFIVYLNPKFMKNMEKSLYVFNSFPV